MKENITLFCGGVGGAKLARGFAAAFPEKRLNIVTNTADDTEFYGLHVSPDLDTMMYTLAGLAGRERSWGIKDDTFHCLGQLKEYGEAIWFKIGDRDVATHVLRTKLLKEGKRLTKVTSHLSRKLGIQPEILPMSDQRVETFIHAGGRTIPFQEYFVLYQNKVPVDRVLFKGIRKARCTGEVRDAITSADLIVFAPSNPVVSILPILSIPGIRKSVISSPALKVAVSPFIGGEAVSGPAKELLESKGFEGSSTGLARFYAGLIDLLFIHYRDDSEKSNIKQLGMDVVVTDTLMKDIDDSVQLVRQIYDNYLREKRGKP